MAYVIAIHVPIAGVAIVPVILGWPLVLLPAHIVFIEFIIDPICSIAFEAEREEADVMSRPPRSSAERLFSWKTWIVSLLQGAGVLAVVLGVLFFAKARGIGESESRALAFATLVAGNLAMVLSNRSWSRGLWATIQEPNRAMAILFSAALGLLGLTLYVPFLARLFHFEALSAAEIALAAAGSLLALAWCELLKRVRSAIAS